MCHHGFGSLIRIGIAGAVFTYSVLDCIPLLLADAALLLSTGSWLIGSHLLGAILTDLTYHLVILEWLPAKYTISWIEYTRALPQAHTSLETNLVLVDDLSPFLLWITWLTKPIHKFVDFLLPPTLFAFPFIYFLIFFLLAFEALVL